jgi:Tfp pilus assembly protein PilO
MADIRDTRRKVITALSVLLCIDLICVAILVSPIGTHNTDRQQQLRQLQTELQTKTREVTPLQGIDKKVQEAKEQVTSFISNRLPSRYSEIADELGKTAQANNVQFSNIRYATEDTDLNDVKRVALDATVAGNYKQVVKFINALERSKVVFLVDSVTLNQEQQQQQPGLVRLTLRLETYMGQPASAPTTTAGAAKS